MVVPNTRLYSGAKLESMLGNLEIQLQKELDSMDLSNISDLEMEKFALELEERYRLNLPVINRNDVHRSEESDCRVDVSKDPSRSVTDRTRPCIVDGKRVVISVPYSGDTRLLFQNAGAPQGFSGIPTLTKETVDFEYLRPLPIDTTLLERDIHNDLNALEASLTWVKSAADLFNREFPSKIRSTCSQRRLSVEAGKTALDGLSIPLRPRQKPAASQAPPAMAYLQPAVAPGTSKARTNEPSYEYDVFICHASADKDQVARPLANRLKALGVRIWYDEFSMKIGDSLRAKIDEGLRKSRFGLVIFSKDFFGRNWTQRELDGLTDKEMRNGQKVILPVWHNVTKEEVSAFSEPLSGKLGGSTKDMVKLVEELLDVLGLSPLPDSVPPIPTSIKDPLEMQARQDILLGALEGYEHNSIVVQVNNGKKDVALAGDNYRKNEEQRLLYLHMIDELLNEGLVQHRAGPIFELTHPGMKIAKGLRESGKARQKP